eukprot:6870598-Pyramimonas_sp.AAC.1
MKRCQRLKRDQDSWQSVVQRDLPRPSPPDEPRALARKGGDCKTGTRSNNCNDQDCRADPKQPRAPATAACCCVRTLRLWRLRAPPRRLVQLLIALSQPRTYPTP